MAGVSRYTLLALFFCLFAQYCYLGYSLCHCVRKHNTLLSATSAHGCLLAWSCTAQCKVWRCTGGMPPPCVMVDSAWFSTCENAPALPSIHLRAILLIATMPPLAQCATVGKTPFPCFMSQVAMATKRATSPAY